MAKYIDFFLNLPQTTWHKASLLDLKFVPMKNHINIHIRYTINVYLYRRKKNIN